MSSVNELKLNEHNFSCKNKCENYSICKQASVTFLFFFSIWLITWLTFRFDSVDYRNMIYIYVCNLRVSNFIYISTIWSYEWHKWTSILKRYNFHKFMHQLLANIWRKRKSKITCEKNYFFFIIEKNSVLRIECSRFEKKTELSKNGAIQR